MLLSPLLHPFWPAAGAGLGGLAGGLLYGSYGAAALFRAAAVTLAVGWLAANAVLRVCGGAAHVGAPCGNGAAQRQVSAEYGEDAVPEDRDAMACLRGASWSSVNSSLIVLVRYIPSDKFCQCGPSC